MSMAFLFVLTCTHTINEFGEDSKLMFCRLRVI